ncbi:MAG: L-lactate permease [Lachnospiraceae bacterium]|nr:L-lactate permease [Lachnospiraceae bacterium]MCI9100657.1 L-lactate permease [Lachnospiraceae bacterium]
MLLLKFVLAMLPIIWLIAALSGLKMAGHKACVIALVVTMALAIGYWRLNVLCTATAALEGALNALWPICLVIVAALFTYNLTLKTGAMELIKKMLAGVSRDKRVLALIIGWGFGNFMEGMAGFGTAVAIPASMLAGIGLDPMSAVLGCLVVNSTPTAFGSVGVPTVTLATVTGLEAVPLAGSVVVIQCILTFISPFLMVCICGKGIKALKGMFPTTLIASLSFTVPWFFTAQFIGPELPDIIGSICSMGCIIAAAKIFNKNPDEEYAIQISENRQSQENMTVGTGVKAWSSFILIFLLLMITSTLCPPIHNAIAGIKSSVVVYAGEGGNALGFSWINTPGVMIFIAAIIGGLIQGASVKDMAEVFLETLKKYWKTILTICSVMATAKIMSYSGMISDIAKFLVAAAGPFYPFIAPFIGALGAFVTGSGTSTCVLFGGLQSETALALGLNASWMAAANVMGAGIGKMICPQGIAIGAGAINAVGSESKILSAVFKYFLLYVILAGVICYAGSMMGF